MHCLCSLMMSFVQETRCHCLLLDARTSWSVPHICGLWDPIWLPSERWSWCGQFLVTTSRWTVKNLPFFWMRFRRVCKLEGSERSLTLQSSHSGPSSRFISLRIRESKDQKIFQARTRFINLHANCRCLFQTLYACSSDPFSGNWFGEIKPWAYDISCWDPTYIWWPNHLKRLLPRS